VLYSDGHPTNVPHRLKPCVAESPEMARLRTEGMSALTAAVGSKADHIYSL